MSSKSRLLELPAELRNRIYQFSLTSPGNLHLQLPDDGEKQTIYRITPPHCYYAKERTEFNRLKYVSKQLFAEAGGLELRYNDIEICADYPEDSPAGYLLDWLSTLPQVQVRWVRKVILKYNDWGAMGLLWDTQARDYPETATILAELTRTCKTLPGMKVQYHLPAWKLRSNARPGTSVPYAVEQIMALRGELAGYDVAHALSRTHAPEWALRKAQCAGRWRQNVAVEDLQAENLRYYPVGPLSLGTAEKTNDTAEDEWIELWPDTHGNMQWVKDRFKQLWLAEGI